MVGRFSVMGDKMSKTAPAMTRREYEYIAATIKTAPIPPRERARVAIHFASALRITNPLFKTGVFLIACGVAEEVANMDPENEAPNGA